jgi:hypothetical protein
MSAARVFTGSAERRSKGRKSARVRRCVFAALLLAPAAFHFADPAAAQTSTGREVTIDGERAKQQFAAGYRVRISANVADDVFAVGREVTIEGLALMLSIPSETRSS